MKKLSVNRDMLDDNGRVWIISLLGEAFDFKSRSEVRRFTVQSGVRVDGEEVKLNDKISVEDEPVLEFIDLGESFKLKLKEEE